MAPPAHVVSPHMPLREASSTRSQSVNKAVPGNSGLGTPLGNMLLQTPSMSVETAIPTLAPAVQVQTLLPDPGFHGTAGHLHVPVSPRKSIRVALDDGMRSPMPGPPPLRQLVPPRTIKAPHSARSMGVISSAPCGAPTAAPALAGKEVESPCRVRLLNCKSHAAANPALAAHTPAPNNAVTPKAAAQSRQALVTSGTTPKASTAAKVTHIVGAVPPAKTIRPQQQQR